MCFDSNKININLQRGTEQIVDYRGITNYGNKYAVWERVFELRHLGIYAGTIKLPLDTVKSSEFYKALKTSVLQRFPGISKYNPEDMEITNPLPFDEMEPEQTDNFSIISSHMRGGRMSIQTYNY